MNERPLTPEQELHRAQAATRLLNDPLFIEARKEIEESLAAQRRKVPLTEEKMHTALILADQLWGQFMDYFKMIEQTGELAADDIARQRSMGERLRRMFSGEPRGY